MPASRRTAREACLARVSRPPWEGITESSKFISPLGVPGASAGPAGARVGPFGTVKLSPAMAILDLGSLFGQIDVYLFDQILRGRIAPGMRILDAGCGGGRNLVFLLQQGYDVCAVDPDPGAIRSVRALAGRLAPRLPVSNFRAEPIEANSFPDHAADVVISERRPALRPGRGALRRDARGHVAPPRTRRPLLLPPRLVDRNGRALRARSATGATGCSTAANAFWWTKRACSRSTRRARRDAGRSAEDHRRPGAALHDHVGRAADGLSLIPERTARRMIRRLGMGNA